MHPTLGERLDRIRKLDITAIAEDGSLLGHLAEALVRQAADVAGQTIEIYNDRSPAEAVKRAADAILEDAGLLNRIGKEGK